MKKTQREKRLAWLQLHLAQLRIYLKPWQERLDHYGKILQERLRVFLHPQQKKLKARWHSLSQREQHILCCGGLAATLLLFYVLIWSPLNTHLDDLRTRITAEKKTAAWAKNVDTQLRNLEERESKLSLKQLSRRINAVQEDLQEVPFRQNLTQLTQSAPNEIRVVFDKVSFDEWVAWLMTFSEQHHLIVKETAVKRLNNIGLVQVSLVLQVG